MRLKVSIVALVALLLAPSAAGATWSQENAGPANHGRLDRATPSTIEQGTFTGLDGRILAQVTEGPAGLVLAGTLSGTVYALDASGEPVWTRDVGDEIRNAPLWTGEHVVVAPRGDQAHAFTARGEPAWTVPIENDRGATLVRMASPVEHPSGDAIVATMAGKVHRLGPDGSTVWTAEIGDTEAVEATPAITSDGDVVAAAFEPGRDGHGLLARIDGADGSTVWETEIDAQVVAAPTVLADTVLVPLRDGNALQARSLSDGSLRWETPFDASITASPTLHDGKAIVGDIRGNLRALDVSGGQEVWSFHPFADDPQVDPAQQVTYTIADSAAVDEDGVAWAPYWVADFSASNCCPPTDSTESPFYRIDAETGELLDRRTYPKANHGPSLHATGVWAGSDEHGVRSWSTGPSLQIHAEGATERAHLIVNTDRAGDWRISADGEVLREGEDRPPRTLTLDLEPGERTVSVTIGDASASTDVTVEAGPTDEDDEPSEPEPAADTANETANGSGQDASEPTNGSDETSGAEPDELPLPALAALLALLAATGVRRRA